MKFARFQCRDVGHDRLVSWCWCWMHVQRPREVEATSRDVNTIAPFKQSLQHIARRDNT